MIFLDEYIYFHKFNYLERLKILKKYHIQQKRSLYFLLLKSNNYSGVAFLSTDS